MLTIGINVTGPPNGHLVRAFRNGGGLLDVLAAHFCVENIQARPAEYAVLAPREIVASGGPHAVQVILTGVTWTEPQGGYAALFEAIQKVAEEVIHRTLQGMQAAEVRLVKDLPPATRPVWDDDDPDHRHIPRRVSVDQTERVVQPKVTVICVLQVDQTTKSGVVVRNVLLGEPHEVTCEPIQVPCAVQRPVIPAAAASG